MAKKRRPPRSETSAAVKLTALGVLAVCVAALCVVAIRQDRSAPADQQEQAAFQAEFEKREAEREAAEEAVREAFKAQIVVPKSRPLKVAFLGDSITAGSYTTKPQNGWPERVTAWLGQETDGRVQMNKQGVSGITSTEALARFTIPAGQDLVFVLFGNNDIYKSEIDQFARTLPTMLKRIEQRSPNAQVVCVSPWTDEASAAPVMDVLQAECENKDVETIVAITDIFALESNRALEGTRLPGGYVVPDSGHPNDQGHAEITERVTESIVIMSA